MALRPIGKFWDLDTDGFIVNDAAPEKISAPYAALVSEARDAYREGFGDDLHSVYVRGTAARGAAIRGVSDFDGFAFVEKEDLDVSWKTDAEVRLLSRHPFVSGVSLDVFGGGDLGCRERFSELALEMATQSACVYGESLIPSLPVYKPGILTANNDVCQIGADIREGLAELEKDASPENVLYWRRRVSKNMIRAGFSITVPGKRRFTRDLFPCFRGFAEFHPDREAEMRETAKSVLEPSDDADAARASFEGFGAWLHERAEAWLEKHNPSRETEPRLGDYPGEARFSRASRDGIRSRGRSR